MARTITWVELRTADAATRVLHVADERWTPTSHIDVPLGACALADTLELLSLARGIGVRRFVFENGGGPRVNKTHVDGIEVMNVVLSYVESFTRCLRSHDETMTVHRDTASKVIASTYVNSHMPDKSAFDAVRRKAAGSDTAVLVSLCGAIQMIEQPDVTGENRRGINKVIRHVPNMRHQVVVQSPNQEEYRFAQRSYTLMEVVREDLALFSGTRRKRRVLVYVEDEFCDVASQTWGVAAVRVKR